MKFALRTLFTACVAAAVAFGSGTAQAQEWTYQAMPLNETAINYLAYRYASSGDNLVFGYECDSVRGINAFFIQTGEPYQAVSGDKGVQTILVINGESLEVRGALQDRGGAQFVNFDGFETGEDEWFDLFFKLGDAPGTISISLLGKQSELSMEGGREALYSAYEECLAHFEE